jgi:hypothetical protein
VKWDARFWAWLLIGGPIAVFSLWAVVDNTRLYFVTLLNGLTLASLYFIVASGFTLVFGLMRNVNLAATWASSLQRRPAGGCWPWPPASWPQPLPAC